MGQRDADLKVVFDLYKRRLEAERSRKRVTQKRKKSTKKKEADNEAEKITRRRESTVENEAGKYALPRIVRNCVGITQFIDIQFLDIANHLPNDALNELDGLIPN